ncbi:hypothetical protein [Streptomyces qinglanensis]|nr:hypothetical protein [Streptomyces qinglanensis]
MTDPPAAPGTLPPGWTTASTTQAAEPTPTGTSTAPAMSGVITTVTSRSDTRVTVHRADYEVLSPQGEYTVHGYAWRCPCHRLALGYRPESGFAAALADGRDHQCGDHS